MTRRVPSSASSPRGLPPVYEPEIVVDAILHAAEHPVRDVFAGGAARVLALGQAISPRLLDVIMLNIGFSEQRTDEPKSEAQSVPLIGDYK